VLWCCVVVLWCCVVVLWWSTWTHTPPRVGRCRHRCAGSRRPQRLIFRSSPRRCGEQGYCLSPLSRHLLLRLRLRLPPCSCSSSSCDAPAGVLCVSVCVCVCVCLRVCGWVLCVLCVCFVCGFCVCCCVCAVAVVCGVVLLLVVATSISGWSAMKWTGQLDRETRHKGSLHTTHIHAHTHTSHAQWREDRGKRVRLREED
jgi:hypothetical protein